jgi:hypothetical protein
MIIISHRGNLTGPDKKTENTREQITKALGLGFHVEIDVWYVDNLLYLGHDKPENEIDLEFIKNEKLWCHAKNINALNQMVKLNIHCFWHQNDDYALTTNNFIWTYPGNQLSTKSICVMPELSNYTNKEILNCAGICSDFIGRYQNDLQL